MKLLIVDDSALMRKYLREIFDQEGDFEIRTARNGVEAISEVLSFQPDVVTLDINMPEMDGLTCLSRIMLESPRPVVMVSSLTESGALVTMEALHLGAVDYIPKPGGTISLNIKEVATAIVQKVRTAARARLRRQVVSSHSYPSATVNRVTPKSTIAKASKPNSNGLVLIGVSTGGPRTLEDILPLLPADFPYAVIVAQHMPQNFTKALAERLDKICPMQVKEISAPTPILAGEILIARGDADIVVSNRFGNSLAMSVPSDQRYHWHPSVDRMVRSAMEHFAPSQLIGVQLTGMGDDGASAMVDLRRLGGHTIAESEETAVVFGMPKELIARGGAEVVRPANRVARQLLQWV